MTYLQPTVIDTFPAFLGMWEKWRNAPLPDQIYAWKTEYLGHWPELLKKQQDCYLEEEEDWERIARERIFPHLGARLPAMKQAHANLLHTAEGVATASQKALSARFEIVLVIYVGIGCGAGWATTYQGLPAVLFGLENVAECGWIEPPALTGLIAHEIAHVVHEVWRGEDRLPKQHGPWWQLYTEGFAQRCEHLILGEDTWHMRAQSTSTEWVDWCMTHRAWLAAEFLCRVDRGQSVRPFFGSWFKLRGYSQTGYYLGHEAIRWLERKKSLRQLALLEEIEPALRAALHEMEGAGP